MMKLTNTDKLEGKWITDIDKLVFNKLYLAVELNNDYRYIIYVTRGNIVHPRVFKAILSDASITVFGEFKFLPISVEEIKYSTVEK